MTRSALLGGGIPRLLRALGRGSSTRWTAVHRDQGSLAEQLDQPFLHWAITFEPRRAAHDRRRHRSDRTTRHARHSRSAPTAANPTPTSSSARSSSRRRPTRHLGRSHRTIRAARRRQPRAPRIECGISPRSRSRKAAPTMRVVCWRSSAAEFDLPLDVQLARRHGHATPCGRSNAGYHAVRRPAIGSADAVGPSLVLRRRSPGHRPSATTSAASPPCSAATTRQTPTSPEPPRSPTRWVRSSSPPKRNSHGESCSPNARLQATPTRPGNFSSRRSPPQRRRDTGTSNAARYKRSNTSTDRSPIRPRCPVPITRTRTAASRHLCANCDTLGGWTFFGARTCWSSWISGVGTRRGPDLMSGPVRAFAPSAEVRGGRWGPYHPVLGSRSASLCVQFRVSNVREADGRDFRPLLVTDRPCARRDRTADRIAADPAIGDAPDWGSWTVGMGLHVCGTVCEMSALPTPGRLRCL